MNISFQLCKYLKDLISKSLEETSIFLLRKIKRYDFNERNEDYYNIDLQVSNLEIYDYSSSLDSVIKHLEKNGSCFEVTYLKHIHSKDCFISNGYDCCGFEEFDLICEKEVDPCIVCHKIYGV